MALDTTNKVENALLPSLPVPETNKLRDLRCSDIDVDKLSVE
jgi:hypothetical protein